MAIDPAAATPTIALAVKRRTIKLGMSKDKWKKPLGAFDKMPNFGSTHTYGYKDTEVACLDMQVHDYKEPFIMTMPSGKRKLARYSSEYLVLLKGAI